MQLMFVTPPLHGPATGGTLYDRQLLAALAPALARDSDASSTRIGQCSLETLPRELSADQVWVDSLYLHAVPELRDRLGSQSRLCLLLHYLPSLLERPRLRRASELSALERAALAHADLIVTPSAWLSGLVGSLAPGKSCACVAPGVSVDVDVTGSEPGRDGSAIMACNVTPNKGVLPLMLALAARARASDAFALSVAGSLTLDAAYARDCVRACSQHPWLRRHVQFLGALPQPELFARLSRASVFVSASVMESYGMALAEARALGLPILAVAGGNVAQHVTACRGGALVTDAPALAEALLALMRDSAALAARQRLARANACARSWQQAAREFIQVAARLARLTPQE